MIQGWCINHFLSQAYVATGNPQLGFRYCAETVQLQRLDLIEEIDQLVFTNHNKNVDQSLASTASESDVCTPTPPNISSLLHYLKEWIKSVGNLSDLFLTRQCLASAEVLLHAAGLVIRRLRSKGRWEGREGRELSELEAIVYRDLVQYLIYRMKTSTSLIGQPRETLDLLADQFNEPPPFDEIRNVTTNDEEKVEMFTVESTQLPPSVWLTCSFLYFANSCCMSIVVGRK